MTQICIYTSNKSNLERINAVITVFMLILEKLDFSLKYLVFENLFNDKVNLFIKLYKFTEIYRLLAWA